jgi:hypothetical protein
MTAAHEKILNPDASEHDIIAVLAGWLQRYQPCLFGRIAAKLGFLNYCILTEADLRQTDEAIKNKIQLARLGWTRDAYEGKTSGFIILAVSAKLVFGLPSDDMKDFAKRLGVLYLETEIETDQIYTDEIFLEKPGRVRTTWRWPVGVNYFSAQGDKRWWQDHRIPGGMAFSMNSVGHMVKSGMLASSMKDLETVMGAPEEGWVEGKIDSLEKALEMALRTIFMASDTVSGKATELLSLPADFRSLPVQKCPVALPPFLKDKNFCEYKGWYHTDYTLPSVYFCPNVERPRELIPHILDFTYLFHENIENPDYYTMGKGRRVRAGVKKRASAGSRLSNTAKNERKSGVQSVKIRDQKSLLAALKFR